MKKYALIFLSAISTVLSSCNSGKTVSLIVHNGIIYTVDSAFSRASAMAIDKGKIVAVGDSKAILEAYDANEEIDLQGMTVLPGLIDAHCHFTGYAMDKWKLNLAGSKSWQEVLDKVKAYAPTTKNEWIYGRGWDHTLWGSSDFPNNKSLDSLFPDRPVYLRRIDGHAAIANSKALEMAGITATSKIPGGLVEVKNGRMTGIIMDNAQELIEKIVPEVASEDALQYFQSAQEECLSLGLTGVHDCGISSRTLDLLKQSTAKGNLKIKVYAFLSDVSEHYDQYLSTGRQTWGSVTLGGYKIYADGALGSRGASLIKPYYDKPGWSGIILKDKDELLELSKKVVQTNMQICTHAIGDSANRAVIDVYATVLPTDNDKRWRIEHAQVLHPDDFAKFGTYRIVPSVQPTHATSDMGWAHQRLGNDRVKHAYAYQDLLKSAGWIILGTDFPVEEIDPLWTFYAATYRQNRDFSPANGWQMENKLSREETLRGMTIWAARGSFQEKDKGSLEVGKAADFIIMNQDIMTIEYKKITQTKVLATYIDGVKVYKAKG